MLNKNGEVKMKNIKLKKLICIIIIFLVMVITITSSIHGMVNTTKPKTTFWWNYWKDFPGRYEPFFDVIDIEDFGQSAYGLTTADFNSDEMLDFAVSWAASPFDHSTITIFYNSGNNDFSREDIFTFNLYIDDLDSADYDNDGDIDLLFTYSEIFWKDSTPYRWNGTGRLLFNDGTNHFNNWRTVFLHKSICEPGNIGRMNPQVTSSDFDSDGDIDFLVGDNSGLVEFYINEGEANFVSGGISEFGGELSWGLSSADFDNDGDMDFIVTQDIYQGDDCIYLKYNDASQDCFNHSNFKKIATIPPTASFFTGVIMEFGCLCSMDYNNDGIMDFVFSGGNSIFLYIQNKDGVFDYFTLCRLPSRNAENGGWFGDDLRMGGIAVGDFDGDNLNDMVAGGSQGVARIFYNNLVLVDIIQPDRGCIYRNNEILIWDLPIYSFLKYGTSIVIGEITVLAKELVPLSKVEFYLDGKLVHTDYSKPYEWNWNRLSFGRHTVKAVAYDMGEIQRGYDDAIVWKFL